SGPSLFGIEEQTDKDTTEQWTEWDMLTYEKETLGFYVSGHPIDYYEKALTLAGVRKTSQLEKVPEGDTVMVAGIISSVKRKLTKHKEKMALFSLDDDEGSVECVAFPSVVAEQDHLLEKNQLVVVEGEVEKTEKATKVITKRLMEVDKLWSRPFMVEINLQASSLSPEMINALKNIARKHHGPSTIYIRLTENGRESLIQTEQALLPLPEVIEEIERTLKPVKIRLYPKNRELVS
ncbi:MAG: hypothetical protein D6778_08890, partial [Nitrospirae bacterium]